MYQRHLAGNRDSHRYSTTGLDNVIVTESSHRMLEVLSFWHRKRAESPSIKITVPTFLVKKSRTQAFRGVDILRISEKI